MKTPKQNFTAKFRALCAALALLLGAIFAPVTLATQSSEEVCAMSCCIAEKHCCCKPAKPSVKEQKGDTNQKQLASAKLTKPCPEGCATSHSSIKTFSRDVLRGANYPSFKISVVIIGSDAELLRQRTATFGLYASRAPPSAFIVSA